jgi:hypothetical protein
MFRIITYLYRIKLRIYIYFRFEGFLNEGFSELKLLFSKELNVFFFRYYFFSVTQDQRSFARY